MTTTLALPVENVESSLTPFRRRYQAREHLVDLLEAQKFAVALAKARQLREAEAIDDEDYKFVASIVNVAKKRAAKAMRTVAAQ